MFEATHKMDPEPEDLNKDPDSLESWHQALPTIRPTPVILGNPANPKQAYGDTKVPLQLVPPALTIHAARALGEGARKYGPYNWRKTKVEAMTYVGAIERHLAAYKDGEDVDPESAEGKEHLDGIAASLAILLDAKDGGMLIDNRPPKGPAAELVRTPVKKESK